MKKLKPIVSLVEFVKASKRANCRVCKLPVEVRGQLGRVASEKKIPRDQQLAWITAVTGVKISVDELNAHVGGRHDV